MRRWRRRRSALRRRDGRAVVALRKVWPPTSCALAAPLPFCRRALDGIEPGRAGAEARLVIVVLDRRRCGTPPVGHGQERVPGGRNRGGLPGRRRCVGRKQPVARVRDLRGGRRHHAARIRHAPSPGRRRRAQRRAVVGNGATRCKPRSHRAGRAQARAGPAPPRNLFEIRSLTDTAALALADAKKRRASARTAVVNGVKTDMVNEPLRSLPVVCRGRSP